MATKISKGQWILGQALVASAVIAGSVAFTAATKVKEVKSLYVSELQSRLERAKEREATLKTIETRLLEVPLHNAVEILSLVQDMRASIGASILLAVEQQISLEVQLADSAEGSYIAQEK